MRILAEHGCFLGNPEVAGFQLRAADQAAVLRLALSELAHRGPTAATVAVPGPNVAAQRLLWQAGFSFAGATGLLCSSRPFGRFDRYLLAGDCLM